MAIAEAEYFERRLDDQISWHARKSSSNQKSFKRLRLVEIVAAAAIPLLSGFSGGSDSVRIVVGALGFLVAVLAGVVSLYRFQENWADYRAIAESLKQEKFLYLARTAPYNSDNAFELLVQRVEGLLKNETIGWAQGVRATTAQEKAESAATRRE